MSAKHDASETVSLNEFLVANALQLDALIQLLIEKRIITEDEYFTKLQHVRHAYKARQASADE